MDQKQISPQQLLVDSQYQISSISVYSFYRRNMETFRVILCLLNINIEHMKYSCGSGVHNPVSVPQKGFMMTGYFRNVSCYGTCVAFLALSMEAIMDSVLTRVYIEVLPCEGILSKLCSLVVYTYCYLFI